eukprot:scaffold148861_cov28-Tisochrysis_lutea.AAC.4
MDSTCTKCYELYLRKAHKMKTPSGAVQGDAYKLHVAVEEPGLDEEARLFGKGSRLLIAVLAPLNGRALDTRERERHLLEAWDEEGAQEGSTGHLHRRDP